MATNEPEQITAEELADHLNGVAKLYTQTSIPALDWAERAYRALQNGATRIRALQEALAEVEKRAVPKGWYPRCDENVTPFTLGGLFVPPGDSKRLRLWFPSSSAHEWVACKGWANYEVIGRGVTAEDAIATAEEADHADAE